MIKENAWTDGRMEGQTEGRKDGRKYGRNDGRTEGRKDERKDGQNLFHRTLPANPEGPKIVQVML